jgi:hypothetical protein
MAWLQRQLAPWAERLRPLQAVIDDQRWNYRGKVCLSAVWIETDLVYGVAMN